MRKKKYLEERLSAVSDYLYISDSEDRNFNTAILNKQYIDFTQWFGSDKPLFLEIGCGKGNFAVGMAAQHHDVNFIAMEKIADVACLALEKAEKAKEPIDERLLAAYNRIRKNVHNGLAVVTVTRDACGGCFNRIPPQRQVDIRQGKKLIVCEYCGRILVGE